jgi:hypothetical protein
VPDEQSVLPDQHGMPSGVQTSPHSQPTQAPPEQTCWYPHQVPSGCVTPVSMQSAPALQAIAPTRHGASGIEQEEPSQHQTHCPPSQMLGGLEPGQQALPSAAGPDSTQTGWPVAHWIAPARQTSGLFHGSVGWQASPAAQGRHSPMKQTEAAPQEVPLESHPPMSVQMGTPARQPVTQPVWQGFSGTQDCQR